MRVSEKKEEKTMTTIAVDVVISEDKQWIDYANFTKAAAAIKQSSEFRRIMENAMKVGRKDGLFSADIELDAIVQTLMIMMIWTGYRIKEQEIAVQELEAFFGNETTNTDQKAIRVVEANTATQGKTVQSL